MKKIALIVLFSLMFAQASFAIVDTDNGRALRAAGHVAKGTAAQLQSDDVGAAKEYSEAAQEISPIIIGVIIGGTTGCFGFPLIGTALGAITGGIAGWLWGN